MSLYTASIYKLPDGEIRPKRSRLSSGHIDRIKDNIPWAEMEACLEWHRLPNEQSRMTAYYACESIAQCGAFIVPQTEGPFRERKEAVPEIFYYELECPSATPTVMAIVKRGMHHLSNRPALAEFCEEYWRQKKARWKYLEFLLPEFKVIKRVDPPSKEDMDSAMRAYTDDIAQAMAIWPERR
ncbi:hypothetical protein [Planctomycetes bacterium K23_9]|uniref:Uncharacterized protein n=1 Tax=Stieleria marina TaxID=1930275 RepID=A0A517NUB5_9BACT|nr:hypothetical protein K239x_26770 [Planctomycetes bacterium K23_9]